MKPVPQQAVLIDSMGNDLSVVRAAKISFADDETVTKFIDDIEASTLGCRSHSGLIRYLATHNHWTPFAHTAVTLRMKAPVPIRTQCFKHKTGLVENEESRRYISTRPELFIPDVFRAAPDANKVKQGSAGPHPRATHWRVHYALRGDKSIQLYEEMIADGVAPEQARLILPQGCHVNWYWTGNLFAFANFFNKRTDSHAQEEIQELANMVGQLIAPLYPVSWAALTSKE